MEEVSVTPIPLHRLASLLSPERAAMLWQYEETARAVFAGRSVWNVNSTGRGGGVAEMLHGLTAYGQGAGVDVRWLVIQGPPEFYEITKRVHNRLHGFAGDGGALDERARQTYLDTLQRSRHELEARVRPGDVVLLHDPQTAGLAQALRDHGAYVVWRCHIGLDERNERTREGWEFLRELVEPAHGYIFSRKEFAPEWIPAERLHIIPPSLDPFSPKNEELTPLGIETRVHRDDLLIEGGPLPGDAKLVLQVSRWDRLKDMGGVLAAFAEHLGDFPADTHLALAGPETAGVADDPEAAEVLDDCRRQWRDLPAEARARTHLLSLPMADLHENARLVNALQRHADVVVQKSLAEGFGLTVTEPMWKARPVIASAIGGIRDQIEHGVSGLLLDDPTDGAELATALASLLGDPGRRATMGAAARERVRELFLADRHLIQYVQLCEQLFSTER